MSDEELKDFTYGLNEIIREYVRKKKGLRISRRFQSELSITDDSRMENGKFKRYLSFYELKLRYPTKYGRNKRRHGNYKAMPIGDN